MITDYKFELRLSRPSDCEALFAHIIPYPTHGEWQFNYGVRVGRTAGELETNFTRVWREVLRRIYED